LITRKEYNKIVKNIVWGISFTTRGVVSVDPRERNFETPPDREEDAGRFRWKPISDGPRDHGDELIGEPVSKRVGKVLRALQ
jgi:hypothetical protein